jgi:hypothetical protein
MCAVWHSPGLDVMRTALAAAPRTSQSRTAKPVLQDNLVSIRIATRIAVKAYINDSRHQLPKTAYNPQNPHAAGCIPSSASAVYSFVVLRRHTDTIRSDARRLSTIKHHNISIQNPQKQAHCTQRRGTLTPKARTELGGVGSNGLHFAVFATTHQKSVPLLQLARGRAQLQAAPAARHCSGLTSKHTEISTVTTLSTPLTHMPQCR